MNKAVDSTRIFLTGSQENKLEGVLLVAFPAGFCFSFVVLKVSRTCTSSAAFSESLPVRGCSRGAAEVRLQ